MGKKPNWCGLEVLLIFAGCQQRTLLSIGRDVIRPAEVLRDLSVFDPVTTSHQQ